MLVFRCGKSFENKEDKYMISKLCEEFKFNQVQIVNSRHSKVAYILNDISVTSREPIGEVSLSSIKGVKGNLDQNINRFYTYAINELNVNKSCNNKELQFDNIHVNDNNIRLLEDYSLIILPGGQVSIDLDKKVTFLELKIQYDEESFE